MREILFEAKRLVKALQDLKFSQKLFLEITAFVDLLSNMQLTF